MSSKKIKSKIPSLQELNEIATKACENKPLLVELSDKLTTAAKEGKFTIRLTEEEYNRYETEDAVSWVAYTKGLHLNSSINTNELGESVKEYVLDWFI